MEEGLRLEPPWRQAVASFLKAAFTPGEPIPHEWFYTEFCLTQPLDCASVKDAQAAQFNYMVQVAALKQELLVTHKIALRSVHGFGYEIVRPEEQTAWAEDEVKENIRKTLRTGASRLVCLKLEDLNAEQQKENRDALARLSFFRKQARKALT